MNSSLREFNYCTGYILTSIKIYLEDTAYTGFWSEGGNNFAKKILPPPLEGFLPPWSFFAPIIEKI